MISAGTINFFLASILTGATVDLFLLDLVTVLLGGVLGFVFAEGVLDFEGDFGTRPDFIEFDVLILANSTDGLFMIDGVAEIFGIGVYVV
jgi:hypothetical protein